jgi:arginine/lysine/ornithine decarboxylase
MKIANPSIKAVVVQSPDYYGQVANLPEIRRECDELGLYMLVDGAHGAHFATLTDGEFPLSPSFIADATNMSAHKTLRAYTQSAYLAINHLGLLPKIDQSLKLLGTTSPSYILMGQLEEAVKFERKHAYGYYALIKEINLIKANIPCLNNDDPMRLVVDAVATGRTGEELYELLAKRGVHAEKYDERYVVFIITLSHRVKDVRKLRKELNVLCKAD